jgi:hypothetical protein
MDKNFFKNNNVKIILGIIWGLGLACIFRSACYGKKCIIYKAPNKYEVKKNIYGYDEKCYKYDTIKTECNDNAINA